MSLIEYYRLRKRWIAAIRDKGICKSKKDRNTLESSKIKNKNLAIGIVLMELSTYLQLYTISAIDFMLKKLIILPDIRIQINNARFWLEEVLPVFVQEIFMVIFASTKFLLIVLLSSPIQTPPNAARNKTLIFIHTAFREMILASSQRILRSFVSSLFAPCLTGPLKI